MTCDRRWQAEAIEDGRLHDAGAGAFARHAAGCAACSAELAALAALRAELERLPHASSNELARRQQRQELLRRANAQLIAPPRLRAPWLATAVAALGVAAALGLARYAVRPTPAPPRAASVPVATQSAAPEFELTASQGASWHTLQAGPDTRLAAVRGRFEIHVRPLSAGQSFVLELPDGELEVQGTRFSVETDGEHTLEVRVQEGKVALRLPTFRAQLRAGEHWSQPAPAAVAPSVERPKRRARPRVDVEPAAQTANAGSDFALAMDAFRAGDYGRADQLFRDFERNHLGDDRVEDALFLRAVAHARRGDVAQRRAVAREYLDRYPQGLRRPDAERLAR